jgi:surface polysaccharide O-acyltransferase-like enzyme
MLETPERVETPVVPTRGQRQRFPDIARILAIVAVVAIHVTAPTNEQFGYASPGVWVTSTIIESAARWAVPMFVMLSGMLLLGDTRMSPGEFYRRRASKVLIPSLVWIPFFLSFRVWFIHEPVTKLGLWQSLAAGEPYYHLYFLFIIIGLYAITPFLARAIAPLTSRQLTALTIGALVFGLVGFGLSPWFPSAGVNAVTQWVPYVGYFLAGPVLARIRLTRSRIVLALVGFVVSVAATALGTVHFVAVDGLQNGRQLYGYLSPTVIVMSVCLFVLIRAACGAATAKRNGVLATVSTATFGVFLIHPIFFEWWIRTPLGSVPATARALAVWWPVTMAGVLVCAFVVALVVRGIPVLRRLL